MATIASRKNNAEMAPQAKIDKNTRVETSFFPIILLKFPVIIINKNDIIRSLLRVFMMVKYWLMK